MSACIPTLSFLFLNPFEVLPPPTLSLPLSPPPSTCDDNSGMVSGLTAPQPFLVLHFSSSCSSPITRCLGSSDRSPSALPGHLAAPSQITRRRPVILRVGCSGDAMTALSLSAALAPALLVRESKALPAQTLQQTVPLLIFLHQLVPITLSAWLIGCPSRLTRNPRRDRSLRPLALPHLPSPPPH
jgi:hypothetical protein